RFLVREVAGIARDVVRDDGHARPDRVTCEPPFDREAGMCRQPRSAPGEGHDLVARDAVDADPAPAGAGSNDLGRSARALPIEASARTACRTSSASFASDIS